MKIIKLKNNKSFEVINENKRFYIIKKNKLGETGIVRKDSENIYTIMER